MKKFKKFKDNMRRLCASALGLSMAAGMLVFPSSPMSTNAAAASYAQPYLDKLVQWDVLRGDENGNLNPDRPITRAEFTAMINRSYGYTEPGTLNFSDVRPDSWYADDISIAQHAGYFTGTSATTAEPESNLTREQAMVLLAKSGRLDVIAGEITEFSDGRDFSSWGKGYVKAAVRQGLINGYPDGTFRPKNPITRAEMSCLLCNALGTLVNTGGTRELGDVYGNVTVNAPGTELKNTTIAGNLYISGGLGLGGVTLSNVKVLGEIIIAGGGESESGQDSVLLRNVEAQKLLIDNLAGNYLSVRAEGDTSIDQTNVRSTAFIRDNTSSGYGLKTVTLDGQNPGIQYSLAGNLKNVVNNSPYASINVGDGSVESLTMDENGAGSALNLDYNATVKSLNLDTGTPVTGSGDVQSIIINSPGSSSEILPDNIEMRPGITADIYDIEMDAQTAQESSASPRLLSGYPDASSIAPTSFTASFSTNKAGTVYWAVSTITDGSIDESGLIDPTGYASKAVKSGKIDAKASNTVYTASVTGLTKGGSYYLSAVLVDARGLRSPVKVISLETPDDTVPAFASGFPVMSKITNVSAQANVMATKSCDLYYALYASGSAAPTTDDFKNNRVSESLGHGILPLTKNLTSPFTVNSRDLEELKSYDLYLWLNDADNAKSSAIRKLTFKTVDKTPPEYLTAFTINKQEKNSIGATASLNENGTLYWVIVAKDALYPKPQLAGDPQPALTSEFAKLQVASGSGGIKSGSVNMREKNDTTINMTGLQPATLYDIYYVAKDSSGNYSKEVIKLTSNTKDDQAPTATQDFDKFTGDDKNKQPYADSSIDIIFSEDVHYYNSADRNNPLQSLQELYEALQKAKKTGDDNKITEALTPYTNALRSTIKLYNNTGGGIAREVTERTDKTPENDTKWTIDYRNATISYDEGKLIVHFPTKIENGSVTKDSALNLNSGTDYYFQIQNISDISMNRMPVTRLDQFKTISSQVSVTPLSLYGQQITLEKPKEDGHKVTDSDAGFSFEPRSTSTTDSSIGWDFLIMADQSIEFDLYASTQRQKDDGNNALDNTWKKVNTAPASIRFESDSPDFVGVSYMSIKGEKPPIDKLNTLSDKGTLYDFAINVTKLKGNSTRDEWTDTVNFRIYVISGMTNDLTGLSINPNATTYSTALNEKKITNIGVPTVFTTNAPFSDTEPPYFNSNYPTFESIDTGVKINLSLNRAGSVYYVIAPVDDRDANGNPTTPTITTQDLNGNAVLWNTVKDKGVNHDLNKDWKNEYTTPTLSSPGDLSITNPNIASSRIKHGVVTVNDAVASIDEEGLEPDQDYYVYFVTKGARAYSPVLLYRFSTKEVTRPVITATTNGGSVVTIGSPTMTSDVKYMLVTHAQGAMLDMLSKNFKDYTTDKNYEDPKDDKGNPVPRTVLQALQESVPGDASGTQTCSIFDEYATQTAKDRLTSYIDTASPSTGQLTSIVGVGNNGGKPIASGSSVVLECNDDKWSKMQEDTSYVFLVMGKSSMGSGYAFRAAYPIIAANSTQVKITNYTPAYDEKNGALTGLITLLFNDYIYIPAEYSGNDPVPVVTSKTADTGDSTTVPNPKRWYGNLASSSDKIEAIENGSSVRTNTLRFNFSGITPNAPGSWYFSTKFCNSDGVPTQANSTLYFILRAKKDADGNNLVLDVEIPSEWKIPEEGKK